MPQVIDSVDTLQSLLRGEISAVETYQQAIETFEQGAARGELTEMLVQHRDTVGTLQRLVLDRGSEAETKSGVWGSWASLVTGTAKAIGPTATLRALREGEEHGVKVYEDAIAEESLDAEARNLTLMRFLPAQHAHIARLQRLIDAEAK
ncbi:MAG: DUF2383 domain-containing protein [Gemmataceae bacterium]